MDRYIPALKYSCLQGSFWMSYCVIYSYAVLYLLSRGYSASQAGVIIAVAGVVSVLLQPTVAGLADRSPRLTLRKLILALAAFIIVCAVILSVPSLFFLWYALFYGIMLATLQIMTPLVNSIGMEWINRGIDVNFGLARGIGSVCYAFASFVTGNLIETFSPSILPILIFLCFLFVFFAACLFHFPGKAASAEEKKNTATDLDEGEAKSTAFFSTYRQFFVLLAGISLLFICHNILNSFLFQIVEYHQGGSREMGIAAAFCASLELPTMIAFTWIVQKVSSNNLLKISGLFFILKALLTFLARGISGVYLAQVAQMFGFALFIPASVYYTNTLMGRGDRARGQAFMTATNTIGSVFGSLLGGFLIDQKGVPAMLLTAVLIAVVGEGLVFLSAQNAGTE